MVKSDKFAKHDTVAAKKAACGYRIQFSCANCVHCLHYYAQCKYNGFPVNLDRGICKFYDNIGKYRT